MLINTFQGRITSAYATLDTETHTYVDGKLLSEREIRVLCTQTRVRNGCRELAYPVSWWREHCRVECWAYIIYTPEGIAIAENWDEFHSLCQTLQLKHGWFYNAPFDFSVLDYQLLSRGYSHVYKVSAPLQYSEMCNDYGARYKMAISFPYLRAPGDRSKRTSWKSNFYDLRNIFPGGLAKNLESFDVRDGCGNPIRKLKMDYQSGTVTESDIKYMWADAAGLWWLIQKSGNMLKSEYGISIHEGKPEVFTASSIAKRYILGRMYPGRSWNMCQKAFKQDHPMSLADDAFYRGHGLLGGGRILLNPAFKGEHLQGVSANRFDANSHYPAYMADMLSVYGYPDHFPDIRRAQEWYPSDSCFIIEICEWYATLKKNAIPAWRNPFTHAIESTIMITPSDTSVLMFIEEWEELQFWYDTYRFKISGVWVYETRKEPAIRDTMLEEYAKKAAAKARKDKAGQMFPKLIMNGYGGKYSQNPWRSDITRELDGFVRRVELKRHCDEKALMNVVQGARITANGRVRLLQAARRITGGKMSDLLLYGDTDSLHTLCGYSAADPYKLGEFKRENDTPIVKCCFIAPKTYYEIEESGKIELHAKGVHIEDVEALMKRGVPIERIYSAGYCVPSLSSLNVPGGKALLPFPKHILKGENSIGIDIDEVYD